MGTAGSRSRHWLLAAGLWLALAGILTYGGWRLIDACGVAGRYGRPLISFCPSPAATVDRTGAAALEDEQARTGFLEAELERLQLALARVPDCPEPEPEPPPPPPEAAPVEEPPAEEPPAEVAEATGPDIPAPPGRRPPAPPMPEPPPPEPTPEPAPEPAGPQPDIPEEAWEEQDISLLDGCWNLISDYSMFRRGLFGQAVEVDVDSWTACFDSSGRGSQDFILDDPSRAPVACSSAIRARFLPNGNLRIDDSSETRCIGGTRVGQRENIVCERQGDGTALCTYRRPGGPRAGDRVTIRLQR